MVNHLCHISMFQHFGQDFSKENLVDSNFEKFRAMTKDQQNIFLIQEFECILTEINCPVQYIMDLFISDIRRDDYVIRKEEEYYFDVQSTVFSIVKGAKTKNQ